MIISVSLLALGLVFVIQGLIIKIIMRRVDFSFMDTILFFILIDINVMLARVIVGGVLLITGLAKLMTSSHRFLNAILGYDLVPNAIARVLARGLPWLEIITGSLLIIGFWSRVAAILGILLLAIFSSAVAISLLRGKEQSCGCFRSLTPVQWQIVYRNMGLMGLLLPIYAFNSGRWAIDYWLFPQIAEYGYFTIGLGILTTVWLAMLGMIILLQQLTRLKSSDSKKSSVKV